MTEQATFTGLGQEAYRASFGDALWNAIAPAWREPAVVLAGDPAALPGDAPIHWLYRSPAYAVLSAPAGDDAAAVLARWEAEARAVLNVRRHWRARLVLVCADDADAARLAALAGVAPPAETGAAAIPPELAPFAPVLKALLNQDMPVLGELFELLQAASANPDAPGAATDGQLVQVLDALTSGRGRQRLTVEQEARVAALSAELSDAAARGGESAAELASLQATHRSLLNSFVEIQEALEARTRDMAEAQAAAELARAESARLQAEVRSLRARVGTAETELRRRRDEGVRDQAARAAAAKETEALRAERQRLMSTLIETQETLERSTAGAFVAQTEIVRQQQALQVAQQEIGALRTQLEYMQHELGSRSRSLVPIAPKAPLPGRVVRKLTDIVRPGRSAMERAARERAAILAELRGARWFDAPWYLAQYGDVAAAGVDPAEHYLDHGAAEGRDPGPNFSTAHYLAAYPDVSASGMNPLLHFVRHGLPEGRLPCRL